MFFKRRKNNKKRKNITIQQAAAVFGISILIYNSFYRIKSDELGIKLRFGEFIKHSRPGIGFKIPFVDKILKKKINHSVNYKILDNVLTSDENLVTIKNLSVNYKIDIDGIAEYLLECANPKQQLEKLLISSVVDETNNHSLDDLKTDNKSYLDKIKDVLQEKINKFNLGIKIQKINANFNPPDEIMEYSKNIEIAKQQNKQIIIEAEAYRSIIIPEARGEAATLINEAEAYKQKVVNMAEGDVVRFNYIYEVYENAKDITKKRMLLDKWDGKFPEYCDGGGGSAAIPYLPLPELKKNK
jgi:modulator of FtsH protease HflK